MPGDEKPVGVAVLGLGNVGSEVVRIIEDSAEDLAARVGAPLVLRGIGVRRVAADRGVPVDLLTDNIEELVSREDVDIVVEVMGPVEPSRRRFCPRSRTANPSLPRTRRCYPRLPANWHKRPKAGMSTCISRRR